MQFLILGILLSGPLALYDVHKRFAGGISLFYAASFGSIQRALNQLDAQGWTVTENDANSTRRRKLYLITEEGREAWRTWMHAPVTGSDAEPVMLAKIYLLGHLPVGERAACALAIRERLAADAAGLAAVAERVDAAGVPDDCAEVFRFQRATLDYGIRSHSLALAWLDELGLAQ